MPSPGRPPIRRFDNLLSLDAGQQAVGRLRVYTTGVTHLQRPRAEGLGDIAFFAVFLVYVWVGIDTRLIYHCQGPVFSTIPGFFDNFLKYPAVRRTIFTRSLCKPMLHGGGGPSS